MEPTCFGWKDRNVMNMEGYSALTIIKSLKVCLLAAIIMLSFLHNIVSASETESKPDFGAWLSKFRDEASLKGIRKEILDTALSNLEPIPRILELDLKQPEFILTFSEYKARVVSESRVNNAINRFKENRSLLREIAQQFQVQPRFIVALWGIESDFGRIDGGFPVIAALATLAYDGRRANYFRNELLEALRIINDGQAVPEEMIGSWAGAMGQLQFMPSTVRRFWVDYNKNSRLDLWKTPVEALASAANYLSKLGWRGDETWGREVKLPAGFKAGLAQLSIQKPLSEWQKLGINSVDGKDLPDRNLDASLVIVEDGGPAFLVYRNYRILLNWNRSTFFAVSVGYLADRLNGL